MKIVSLSFDDGTIYDLRFIELLNKYNLKATLNLNSELKDFVWYYNNQYPIKRLDLEKVKDAYKGQEVASHSLTHPYFSSLDDKEVIRQVKEDVENLSKIFGYKIEGFALPFHDQTEENIQKAIGALAGTRTIFAIAHRLSTIRSADKIIVMKDGHVIEIGNHEELLKLKGFYHELYNSQFAKVEQE